MKESNFFYHGITALLFAVLFPVYWVWLTALGFDFEFSEIAASDQTTIGTTIDYVIDAGLTSDYFVWILLGLMTLFVYLGLKQSLIERHNYSRLNLPIHLAIASTLIIYGGLAGLEFIAVMIGVDASQSIANTIIGAMTFIFFAGLIVQGLIDIIIGIILLRDAQELPNTLRIFAIITLISGILGITVIFALATVLTVPLATLVLGIYFLRQPEMIDVI